MKNYLVIGASGLIGGALFSLLQSKQLNVRGTYTRNKENALLYFDIIDPDYKSLGTIKENDVVYILSAYSNPSWIANNKKISKELNFTRTIKLIDFLITKKARIIFMSSVEIFDGNQGNYFEEDDTNPLNYYGLLKLKVEEYLIANSQNFTIVRTGWNIGLSQKSRCVVQLTYETLLGKNAKMAHDNFFSLCSIEDNAEGLYRISLQKKLEKIHICSDEIINRMEMAELIISTSSQGSKMSYSSCPFEEIPYSEPRGRVNNLNNTLSKKLLDLNYSDAFELIADKVNYLDKGYK